VGMMTGIIKTVVGNMIQRRLTVASKICESLPLDDFAAAVFPFQGFEVSCTTQRKWCGARLWVP
jgi:hypothetical protein